MKIFWRLALLPFFAVWGALFLLPVIVAGSAIAAVRWVLTGKTTDLDELMGVAILPVIYVGRKAGLEL